VPEELRVARLRQVGHDPQLHVNCPSDVVAREIRRRVGVRPLHGIRPNYLTGPWVGLVERDLESGRGINTLIQGDCRRYHGSDAWG
jgi:hypothetical protein